MSKKNKSNIQKKDNNLNIDKIKNETLEIIKKLENDKNKTFLSKSKKELIENQINDLNRFLNEEQYHLLDSKLKALNEIENQETKQKNIDKELDAKEERKPIKVKIQQSIEKIQNFERWPFYYRFKKICDDFDGKEKTQRIVLYSLLYFVLIVLSLIGILLIASVIPYSITQDTTKIGPWIIFVIPFTLLFFI